MCITWAVYWNLDPDWNWTFLITGQEKSRADPFSISFQLQPEISELISEIYTGWAVAPSLDSRHPTPAQQLGAARQKAACEPFAIYDALTIPGVFITILRKLKFYSFPPLSRQKSGLPLFICPNPLNKRSCKSGSCPQAINTWWNYRSAASLKLTFNLACLDDLGELFFSEQVTGDLQTQAGGPPSQSFSLSVLSTSKLRP